MPWNPDQLKKLREKRGLTQEEFARHIGSNRVSIAKMETGAREPGIDLLERIAKGLRVPVAALLRKGGRTNRRT